MRNPAPYRYDIVGSFLRTAAIHEARAKFESDAISAEKLSNIEDAEIRGLVKKEGNVGLKAVTDGEYRRSFWHMDFLWGLIGTRKVRAAHFSVAFKGFQPKAETVKIVDKLEFIASLFVLPYFCCFKQLGNQFLLSFCIAAAILRKLLC